MGKHSVSFWIRVGIVFAFAISNLPAQAQGGGPLFAILGKIDAKSSPPDAHAYVSVVDPTTGRALEGLTADNFAVQISEEDVPVSGVQPATSGVAIVVVVDRGGIGRDVRREQVVDLTDALLNRLTLDGSTNADMIGLIGIRGREEERETGRDLVPKVPFTDFDPNLISNEFDALRTEVVQEVTPLYDGLDEAVEWLTKSASADTRAKLEQRRKIIIVFSDGIDRRFSSEAHETSIIDECRKNNIAITAIRMAAGDTDADNLEVLARQTNGLYLSYKPAEEDLVYTAFDNLVSQRNAYQITFPVIRPKNDYIVTVKVLNTPVGDAETEGRVASTLVPPSLTLVPPTQQTYTVPYSETVAAHSFITTVITMSAQLTFSDGVPRNVEKVTYFANGAEIGSSSQAPNFDFTWALSDLYTPTYEVRTQDYSLSAKVKDPYLNDVVESELATIKVTWEAMPKPVEPPLPPPETQWASVILIPLLLIGTVILLVLLLRTRRELAKRVVARTTGFIKGVTQRLSGGSSASVPAYAQLVIMRGRNPGTEFKIAAPLVKIGRDPQFCDFALYDQYMSNPHFSIMMEQTQFFIVDEGSTNGTRLNGSLITPHQRMPLMPDAIIETGQVQMQFKRVGGATRQLGEAGETLQQQPYANPMPFAGGAAPQQPYAYPGEQPQTPGGGGVTQPPRQP